MNYKSTKFWENIKRTLATFSGPAVVGVHEFGASDGWMMAAAGFAMAGAILTIWMTDHDNDGTVDIFQ